LSNYCILEIIKIEKVLISNTEDFLSSLFLRHLSCRWNVQSEKNTPFKKKISHKMFHIFCFEKNIVVSERSFSLHILDSKTLLTKLGKMQNLDAKKPRKRKVQVDNTKTEPFLRLYYSTSLSFVKLKFWSIIFTLATQPMFERDWDFSLEKISVYENFMKCYVRNFWENPMTKFLFLGLCSCLVIESWIFLDFEFLSSKIFSQRNLHENTQNFLSIKK